jgi:alanine racemase
MNSDVWAEINLSAIEHNLEVINKALLPDTGVIGVVKSNAYGHGLIEVSKVLEQSGIDMFAVTSIAEALDLRKNGISKSILNLSYTDIENVEICIDKKVTITVYDLVQAEALNSAASKIKKPLRVHIKIDTGMSRLGIAAEDVDKVVPQIMRMPYLRVDGIYSHFADEDDESFVTEQFNAMQKCLFDLQRNGFLVPAVHMAKSGILFKSNEYHFDAVRPGIALYGYKPNGEGLEPALSLKTKLAQIKRIKKGAKVGYMQTFTAPADMNIGILPIGYAHGYDRGLSNKGYVLIDEWKCPVIGRICMGQTIVDLSSVRMSSKLHIGKEVVVIGKQGRQEITVDEVAKILETNTYEVVTRIPESVERIYLNK